MCLILYACYRHAAVEQEMTMLNNIVLQGVIES